MRFALAKETIAAAWVLSLSGLGLAAGLTSAPAWLALAAMAFTSVGILQWLWRVPAPTMSESIQQARR